MAKHSPIDDAVAELLATNSLHALADLVTNPEIAERIRGKRIGDPSRDQTMVQGRATVILLRDEIGETRLGVLSRCIASIHYGNPDYSGTVLNKILSGSLKTGALAAEARELANWLRESPTYMRRLRDVHAQFAAAKTTPIFVGAKSLGVSSDDDDV
ncbi:hypothetical protein IVB30_02055 [Bradyrhizobium sp. 200]|uniref:hypothetical protein n=1 Tax=Bradyrhizobium sp. 200 TaxID=2782665 RepID=UPI00200002AA|nr:hypothetical protein [Bradyrhizobium sp. 200]UPJ50241.1 hypothetical protein IVB30_02055 [Bradyrhizobium sp. 200]